VAPAFFTLNTPYYHRFEQVQIDETVESKPTILQIESPTIVSYARGTIEAAFRLSQWKPNVVFAPARGGLKLLESVVPLISFPIKSRWFAFTNHSTGKHDDAVCDILRTELVRLRKDHVELPRLALLDTAKGGYGAARLVRLFAKTLRSTPEPRPPVLIVLVHASSQQPRPRVDAEIVRESRDGVVFDLHTVPVHELLFEDRQQLLDIPKAVPSANVPLDRPAQKGALELITYRRQYTVASGAVSRTLVGLIALAQKRLIEGGATLGPTEIVAGKYAAIAREWWQTQQRPTLELDQLLDDDAELQRRR
jgi:hypothetical protein